MQSETCSVSFSPCLPRITLAFRGSLLCHELEGFVLYLFIYLCACRRLCICLCVSAYTCTCVVQVLVCRGKKGWWVSSVTWTCSCEVEVLPPTCGLHLSWAGCQQALYLSTPCMEPGDRHCQDTYLGTWVLGSKLWLPWLCNK